MTDPDTIAAAVLSHIDLALPPTDAEVFEGVPEALPEEITQKIESPVGRDEDWEDEETGVFSRPIDPTGCMM